MNLLYFDNAAAAMPLDSLESCDKFFANPSSLHDMGILSEQKIKAASDSLARLLHCRNSEIIFTSGATESNNLALKGAAYAKGSRQKGHIITSDIEHPSVSECAAHLASEGFAVTYLGADKNGNIREEELRGAVRPDTFLVSLFYVNNETGTINDIERFASAVKETDKKILFHTDAAQAFGKLALSLKNVDLLSFSGHKIHGPKGIGGLYIRSGTKIAPLFHGGGQQGGIRPGTENTQGIAGLCQAFRHSFENMEANLRRVRALKEKVLEIRDVGGISVNGDNTSPYILNISIAGVKGEILLNALSSEGIYVSTGSACHSRRAKRGVIYKINPDGADGALRISFCAYNTPEECGILNEALRRNIKKLRKGM